MPFFELFPNANRRASLMAFFRTHILAADRDSSGWRWCVAGTFGAIEAFDHDGLSMTAVDPTGILSDFASTYDFAPDVDILFGAVHVTCVPMLMFARNGRVRLSATTREVGLPMPFEVLTRFASRQRKR
jgi:hypothetical protein